MNLKIKIYTAIMAFSVAVIIAVLSVRRIQSVWFPPSDGEQTLTEEDTYYPFAAQDLAKASSEEEQPPAQDRIAIAVSQEDAYVPQKQIQKPYFGGQIDLPALAKEQKAYILEHPQQTNVDVAGVYKNSRSAELDFTKYEQDPRLKRLMGDVKKALGEDAFNGSIPPEQLADRILKSPQMQKILLEYSKDPEVMQMVGDMFEQVSSAQNGRRVNYKR